MIPVIMPNGTIKQISINSVRSSGGAIYYPGYAIKIDNDTIKADTQILSGYYVRIKDSVRYWVSPAQLATALSNYYTQSQVNALLASKLSIADTANMLLNYVRRTELRDTSVAIRGALEDTAAAIRAAIAGGGISYTAGYGLILNTTEFRVDTSVLSTVYARIKDSTTRVYPGAPNNSVQFNNSGTFGGSSNLTWDNTNSILNILTGGLVTQGLQVTGDALFNGLVSIPGVSAFPNNQQYDFLIRGRGVGNLEYYIDSVPASRVSGLPSLGGYMQYGDTARGSKVATYFYVDSANTANKVPTININQLYNTHKYEPIKIPFPPGETLTAYTPHAVINRASPDSILITYKADQTKGIYLGYSKDTGKTAVYIDTIMRVGAKTYAQTDVQEGIIVYGTDSIRVFPQCDSSGISSIGYVKCAVNDKYNWSISDRPIYTTAKFLSQTGLNASYLSFADYTLTNDSMHVTLVVALADSGDKYRNYLLKAAANDWYNLSIDKPIARPNAPFNDIYSSVMFKMSDSLWHMIYTQGAPNNGDPTQKYHVKTAWSKDKHGPWIQEAGIFMQGLFDSSWKDRRIYGVDVLKDNETHSYLKTYKDSIGEYALVLFSASAGNQDRSSISRLYLNTSKNDTLNEIYVDRSHDQLNIYGRKRFLNELITSDLNAYKAKIGTTSYSSGTKVYPVIVTSDSNKVQNVTSIPVSDVTGALSWSDTTGNLATDYDLSRKHTQGGDARGVNDTIGTKDNNDIILIRNGVYGGKLTANGFDIGNTTTAYSGGQRGPGLTDSWVNNLGATGSTSNTFVLDIYQLATGNNRIMRRDNVFYEGDGANSVGRYQISLSNASNNLQPAFSFNYIFNQSVKTFVINRNITYDTKTFTPIAKEFEVTAANSNTDTSFVFFNANRTLAILGGRGNGSLFAYQLSVNNELYLFNTPPGTNSDSILTKDASTKQVKAIANTFASSASLSGKKDNSDSTAKTGYATNYRVDTLNKAAYRTVQLNGTPLGQMPTINFSPQFAVSNSSTRTDVSITAIAQGVVTGLDVSLDRKLDSVRRSRDTVYEYKAGVRYFAYKDSTGSASSGIPYTDTVRGKYIPTYYYFDSTLKALTKAEFTDIVTTNATPTTSYTFPAVPSNKVVLVKATITGVSATGAIGGQVAALFKNTSGTVAMVGTVDATITQNSTGDLTAGNYTIGLTGTTPFVQVTGVAATTVNWHTEAATIADVTLSGGVNPSATWGGISGTLSDQTDLQAALDAKVPTTRTISTTSPLSGGGDLSANRTLAIANAAADGSTKGAASFTANDFDAASGNISIDYTNGQKATGSVPGFVSTAAQTFAGVKTFNNQYSAARYTITYSSTVAVDFNNGNCQFIDATGNWAPSAFSNPIAGGRYLIQVNNNGGSRTITWPASVKWPGGTTPTPSASGKVDVYSLYYDGTSYYGGANLNY